MHVGGLREVGLDDFVPASLGLENHFDGFANGARPLDDFIKVIDEELQKAGIEPAAPDAPSP